jgi:hypothetical protein
LILTLPTDFIRTDESKLSVFEKNSSLKKEEGRRVVLSWGLNHHLKTGDA